MVSSLSPPREGQRPQHADRVARRRRRRLRRRLGFVRWLRFLAGGGGDDGPRRGRMTPVHCTNNDNTRRGRTRTMTTAAAAAAVGFVIVRARTERESEYSCVFIRRTLARRNGLVRKKKTNEQSNSDERTTEAKRKTKQKQKKTKNDEKVTRRLPRSRRSSDTYINIYHIIYGRVDFIRSTSRFRRSPPSSRGLRLWSPLDVRHTPLRTPVSTFSLDVRPPGANLVRYVCRPAAFSSVGCGDDPENGFRAISRRTRWPPNGHLPTTPRPETVNARPCAKSGETAARRRETVRTVSSSSSYTYGACSRTERKKKPF